MDFNLAEVIRAVAKAVPTREALVHDDNRLTYAAFMSRVDRLASALASRGLGHHTDRSSLKNWQSGQDHVALYLHNCPEYIESVFAAFKVRATPVNVNYRYLADEVAYILANSDAEVLVFHGSLADRLADVRSRAPHLCGHAPAQKVRAPARLLPHHAALAQAPQPQPPIGEAGKGTQASGVIAAAAAAHKGAGERAAATPGGCCPGEPPGPQGHQAPPPPPARSATSSSGTPTRPTLPLLFLLLLL
jgi:acyl-CoA synthetase (AMP-forming)/AMP-acid ligase II